MGKLSDFFYPIKILKYFFDFCKFDFLADTANISAKNHQNVIIFHTFGKYIPIAEICDQPRLSSSISSGDIALCS